MPDGAPEHGDATGTERVAVCLDDALARLAGGSRVRVGDYEEALGGDLWLLTAALEAEAGLSSVLGERAPNLALFPWTLPGYRFVGAAGSWARGRAYRGAAKHDGHAVFLLCPAPGAEAAAAVHLRRRHAARHPRLCRTEAMLGACCVLRDPGGVPLGGEAYADGTAAERSLGQARAACGDLADVAAALHALHERGLIHGHVTPQALRCVEGGGLMLLDAAPMDHVARYRSPEERGGMPGSARSDVYALAAIAFDLLAGRLPASSEGRPPRRFQSAREGPLPLPPGRWRTRIEAILFRGLAEDPARRQASAAALGRALHAVGEGGRRWPRLWRRG